MNLFSSPLVSSLVSALAQALLDSGTGETVLVTCTKRGDDIGTLSISEQGTLVISAPLNEERQATDGGAAYPWPKAMRPRDDDDDFRGKIEPMAAELVRGESAFDMLAEAAKRGGVNITISIYPTDDKPVERDPREV